MPTCFRRWCGRLCRRFLSILPSVWFWDNSKTIFTIVLQITFIPNFTFFPCWDCRKETGIHCVPTGIFFLWNDIVVSFTTCSYYLPEGSFYEDDTLFKVLPEQLCLKWQVWNGLFSVKKLDTKLTVKWHSYIHQLSGMKWAAFRPLTPFSQCLLMAARWLFPL